MNKFGDPALGLQNALGSNWSLEMERRALEQSRILNERNMFVTAYQRDFLSQDDYAKVLDNLYGPPPKSKLLLLLKGT
jgi:hypothetical protein